MVTTRGKRPTQVTAGGWGWGAAGVAEEGMSAERPQSKLNHPAPSLWTRGRDGGGGREGGR